MQLDIRALALPAVLALREILPAGEACVHGSDEVATRATQDADAESNLVHVGSDFPSRI